MKPQQPIIAGIGELLWDVLPTEENLGGAPVNFCYHAAALGADARPISTIGDDLRGSAALAVLRTKRLETGSISIVDGYPTGYVTACLDSHGVATYQFPPDVAWDHLNINDDAHAIAPRLQAVCFGTLAQRSPASRRVIRDYLRLLPSGTLRVFDINLRQHFFDREIIETSLQLCSILKLNEDELDILSSLLGLGGTVIERLQALQRVGELELVLLTKGPGGSVLLSPREQIEHPGENSRVVDTIGAGDAFTAAVTVGLLHNRPLAEISTTANRIAAYVCGQAGAMPDIPASLRNIACGT